MARFRHGRFALSAALIAAVTAVAIADTPPPAPAPTPPSPATFIIAKRSPFKAQVDLDAVFEASQMWPLQVDTTVWHVQAQALEVLEAAPQGKAVKAGEVVMRFETRWIDLAIRDAQLALTTAETKQRQAEQDAQFAKRLAELDIAAVQRLRDRADADLQRFGKIERPLTGQRCDDLLKNTQFALEYAKQELKQLEKMYKADDLTEETEEIVLTRQRRAVEAATFALRNMENEIDKTKNVALPRQQDELEAGLRGATYALDVQKAGQPVKVALADQTAAKAQNDAADAKRKLQDLLHDRDAMTVKSPGDGILYYGHCERGRWFDAANVDNIIRAGGTFRPKAVLVTVVAARPVQLHTNVIEAALRDLRPGLVGVAVPAAYPDRALAVKIKSIDDLPLGSGNEVAISLDNPADLPADLMPGMNCRVKFTYENPRGIAVPFASLHTDEPGKCYVKVRDAAGALTDRTVKPGRRSAGFVEIREGLEEGDVVEVPAPSAPPSASPAAAPVVPPAPAAEKK